MRLTTVILIASLVQVSAATFGQRITLNKRNVSLFSVLKDIRKQTGYDFYYDQKTAHEYQRVSIICSNANIEDALRRMLSGLDLSYEIVGKTVSIKKKEKSSNLDKFVIRTTSIDVKGRVLDHQGKGMVGATIREKGTNNQTTSGQNGAFTLRDVNENSTVEISFIGYIAYQTKPQPDLGDIQLNMSVADLQEVDVVNKGYYAESKKLSTGNVAKVTAQDIRNQPVTNVMTALSGRIPGLNIVQSTGAAGAGISVLIRGKNSIAAGTDPLYIVDGVPFSSQSLGDPQVSRSLPALSGAGGLNPLNTLNPSDILTIEVLKDADATAIYGSRGANGVILITTKKGKSGKTKVELNINSGYSEISRKQDLMNTEQYLAMRREAFSNDGITTYRAQDFDVNGTWSLNRYTDWQKKLIGGKAHTLNLQSAISGGNELTQFLARGSYQSETSVMPGDSKYGRAAALFNLVHRSKDNRFHFSLSNTYSTDKNNNLGTDLTKIANTLSPNAPALYNQDGSLNWENSTWINPLAQLEASYKGKTRNMTANANLDYHLANDLVLKLSLGYNDYRLNELRTDPSTVYDPAYGLGSESSSSRSTTGINESWIIEPQINWKKQIGKSGLDLLVGTTFQQQNSERQTLFAYNFPSNGQIHDFTAATTQIITRDMTIYKYQAIYARANFNWKKKYILNLTARRDGSSRFGPERQFANFGAIGAAWIFSDENLIKNAVPFLSLGKLRGSYGITGNDQIGDYQFLDTYQSTTTTYQGTKGLRVQRLYNPDFGWETNHKLEAALELGLLKDRINFSVVYYRNRSSNQLVGIPLPGTTGFNSILANLDATLQNKGWELEFQSANFQKGKFKWNSAFNFTIPKSKLISFPGLAGSTYANQYIIGGSITLIKLYNFTGYDEAKGKYLVEDVNKDGKISAVDDKTAVADLAPKYFGGLSNSFSFGPWQLDVFIQFIKQKRQGYLFSVNAPGGMQNMPTAVMNRYPNSGVAALVQRYSATNSELSTAHTYFAGSNKAIVDASYLRLKNIAVSYKIKALLLKGTECSLFLRGQNLLTITKFIGDPESALNFLPTYRTITTGMQVFF